MIGMPPKAAQSMNRSILIGVVSFATTAIAILGHHTATLGSVIG